MKKLLVLAVTALAGLSFAAWAPPQILGRLENPAVDESSGIAASRRNPGLYWTHNDSGGLPQLYLFDNAGRDRGTYTVDGARNRDWEDIAVGPGPERGKSYVYIGDIGDNSRRRREVIVYRVPEPLAGSGRTEPATPIRIRYPDGPHDAEALVVHPRTADIYIITKARFGDSETGVYKAGPALRAKGPITMVRLGSLTLPSESELMLFVGLVTGGDASPDGKRVVLCDYLRAYEARLPDGHAFDDIWKQPWEQIEVGSRRQGEAVCYRLDGKAILLTSEGYRSPLLQVLRRP